MNQGKFTDLDLEHKRQLLLNFKLQNTLAYELADRDRISVESLIAKIASYYSPEIQAFSEEEINSAIEAIEEMDFLNSEVS